MAWNPSPKVAAARDIGKKFRKPQVVVLMIDQDAGTLEFASYGDTRELCAEAKRIGDFIGQHINSEECRLAVISEHRIDADNHEWEYIEWPNASFSRGPSGPSAASDS